MKKNLVRIISAGIATVIIAGIVVCVQHTNTRPSDVGVLPTPPAIVQQVEENNDIEPENKDVVEVEVELNNTEEVVELGAEDFHCEFDYTDATAYIIFNYTDEDMEVLNWAVDEGKTTWSYIEQRYNEWSEEDFDKWLNGQIDTFKDDKAREEKASNEPWVSAEETKESIKKHNGIG